MAEDADSLTRRQLRTPRAAAVAGIIFAVLLSTSYVLIRISTPADPLGGGSWLEEQSSSISLALSMVPFAGIAFLWFMGVVRDRIGHLEDQLFSTVFLGSGLLFLGMTFIAAALAGGMLSSYAVEAEHLVESGVYTYSRAVMYRVMNVYAIRMAGVFMISLGTIWVRTRTMPRWMALITYGAALVLLVSIGYMLWVTLIFPVWVGVISAAILVWNYRQRSSPTDTELIL